MGVAPNHPLILSMKKPSNYWGTPHLTPICRAGLPSALTQPGLFHVAEVSTSWDTRSVYFSRASTSWGTNEGPGGPDANHSSI